MLEMRLVLNELAGSKCFVPRLLLRSQELWPSHVGDPLKTCGAAVVETEALALDFPS